MAPEAFGVIAVIGFGLSAVLAIVAAAYGVTHHVRSVHDELTGRAAQRAIDAMREGRSSVPALGVQQGSRGDVQSGSLRLREVNSRGKPFAASSTLPVASDTTPQSEEVLESESGTTLLDTVAPSGCAPDSEAGTTLLSSGVPSASSLIAPESEATLLARDAPVVAPADGSESETTLLGSGAPNAAASESDTTLLSGKED